MLIEIKEKPEGVIKTIIPKNPKDKPMILKILNSLFLNKEYEISNVKSGIVPIRVDATTLST